MAEKLYGLEKCLCTVHIITLASQGWPSLNAWKSFASWDMKISALIDESTLKTMEYLLLLKSNVNTCR